LNSYGVLFANAFTYLFKELDELLKFLGYPPCVFSHKTLRIFPTQILNLNRPSLHMPHPAKRLTLIDIKSMFPYFKLFTFKEISEGRVVYETDDAQGVMYYLEFHPHECAHLEQSCIISDIIAAIDESRYFGLTT
jgi:hypothetical protein